MNNRDYLFIVYYELKRQSGYNSYVDHVILDIKPWI